MPSTNGHKKRAVLYCRVSTDEQARSGYSLAQQLEALREYAAREGYEVLEEVTDPGQSGASLERPGLDRVRDLVADSSVGVVLAQDRDRFAREPAYLYLLRQEFAEYGAKIRALNDRGDDSPEGELMDGVFDQFAKFERAKTAERSRRGKLQKVRQGKLLAATPRPRFGFSYNDTRDGYEVDEEVMPSVRRIFWLLGGEGTSLHGVRRALEHGEVSAPSGGRRWSRTTIREIVMDDCYKPHTFEEVKELVSSDVAARLDPEKRYGIWWFNRRRNTVRQVAESGPEGKRYRRQYKTTLRPREEWIAVPIPDAGVPRELVEAAREVVKENPRPSSAGERFWELSGGVFVCGACGCRMLATRKKRSPDSDRCYHYYRCPTRRRVDRDACPQGKTSYRAEEIEERVWRFISDLLKDPSQLRDDLDTMIELQGNGARGDPEREAKAWLEKLVQVDRKRSGYIDLAADGIMDRDELRTKLAALEETRETAQRELEALHRRREEIEELERDRDALLDSLEAVAPDVLDTLTPEERHHVYRMLRLRVLTYPDGTLEARWAFGACSFWTSHQETPPTHTLNDGLWAERAPKS